MVFRLAGKAISKREICWAGGVESIEVINSVCGYVLILDSLVLYPHNNNNLKYWSSISLASLQSSIFNYFVFNIRSYLSTHQPQILYSHSHL